MISIVQSFSNTPHSGFDLLQRKSRENNIFWLERAFPNHDDYSYIILVGGIDSTSFRLRVAQSHARHDMTPSHWSHAVLVNPYDKDRTPISYKITSQTPISEISLEPPQGFGFPPPTSGIQEGKLEQYRDPQKYPNIGIIGIPVPWETSKKALERLQINRSSLDTLGLIIRWLAFIWGAGSAGNPLFDGVGIPSAAMLEVIFNSAGYDLTPGLESRSSCPEAIWQAAKWWHDYYDKIDQIPPLGKYYIGNRL